MSFLSSNNNNNNNFFPGGFPSSSSTAVGWPLPNTDAKSLQELNAPMTSDWLLEVDHALPHLAHLHPSNQRQGTTPSHHFFHQSSNNNNNNNNNKRVPLNRGDAIVHRPTGQRGIYLGRPLQASRGQIVFCVMRDSTANPPRATLIQLPMTEAANQLLFLPDRRSCPFGCGFRIPEDEINEHGRMRHGGMTTLSTMNNNNNNNSTNNNVPAPLFGGGAPNPFNQQQQAMAQNMSASSSSASPITPSGSASSLPSQQPLTTPTSSTEKKVAGDHHLMSHLKKIKKLGEGAQGIVWQCRVEPADRAPPINTQNGQTPGYVVLKSVKCKDEKVALNRFDQSVRLMQMKTAHLVPYFAIIYDPKERDVSPDTNVTSHVVHVIMPYYSSGSLTQQIAQQRGKVTEQWLLSTLLQLANALNLLHGHKPQIVHGDVKPDNILMFGGSTSQVLLMDLEASTVIPPGCTTATADNEGTYEWRAPECIVHGKTEPGTSSVSTATDMWSLGVVAMVLAILPDWPALKNPDSRNEEVVLNHESWSDSRLYYVIHDAIKSKGYEGRTAEIICSLVRQNPKDRPTTHILIQVLTEHMENMILAEKFG